MENRTKRFLSLIFALVMVMAVIVPQITFGASAAATYEKATSIAVGDTVVLVYEASTMELSSISNTSTIYGIGTVYTNTPAGLYPLTVEAGSSSGTYAFKTSDGKYLYWTSGNSLNVNATKSANTSWTVTFDASGNATIKNAKDNSRLLQWNTSSPRFACYLASSKQKAIQLYKLTEETGGGSGTGCAHTEHNQAGECTDCGEPVDHSYVDGVCGCGKACTHDEHGTDGKCTVCGVVCEHIPGAAATCTSNQTCTVCGKVLTAGGHKVDNGYCTVCKERVESAVLSFATVDNRTSLSNDAQIWEQNGVKLTNNKNESTNPVADYCKPARFYKGSGIVVESTGMSKIEFACNTEAYATALQGSVTGAEVNGKVVTVAMDESADSFTVAALGGQVRVDSITVYYDHSHVYGDDDKCVCGDVCTHAEHGTDGKCTVCEKEVGHTYNQATGLCKCGAKEAPKSDAIAAYTSATTIWGETWSNARESYAIKVLDASGNVMGTTTLNTNLDVSMDGDVKVSWHITLPGNADADEYWIQEWTIAPTLDNMPAKVELWIDGVKTSESAIQLNGPDDLNKIVAAVADADGKITSYATTFAAALTAAPDNGTVKLLSGPDVAISAAGVVCGKTVTVTGTAKFDWSKGWLYVGREGAGDGKLIFKETTITSDEASLMNGTYGIHVSGAKAENKGNTYDGTVVFENSDIQLSYLLNHNEVTVDGGKLYVGRGFYIHGRNAGESYSATDETATITIKNGAVVEVKQNNGTGIGSESYGVMNIEGATFKAHESGFALRENGTINISGNSSVSMNLSGDGAVNVAAGTSLTDTTIAGAGTVKFNTGVTNFYGSNTVTAKIDSSVADFDLVVNKGATLLISRYVLGYDRDITVYGEIKDATALTADEVAAMTPSLRFDGGASINGWNSTGKLTVQDAYVELDSSSLKAGATGTYEWNFKNAYVKAASLLNTNAAGTSGSMTLNFADSVVASGYIKNGTGVTYNFTDGSVATTGSICINGVLNIDETSSITTTAYQNNKKGAQDEHGDISGTVNVAGKLTIGSTAVTDVELYGGELNVNGGTLDLGTNSLVLDAASTVKVTVPGTITAKTITIPDTITIDATNLEAGKEYTVIVLDGTESLEDKVTFVGDVVATYGADGDVTIEKAVAKVGNTCYTSVFDAVKASTVTDTITLLTDAKLDYVLDNPYQPARTINAAVIDLNSKTLTLTNTDLRFSDVTIKNGNIVVDPNGTYNGTGIFYMFGKTLTFEDVKIDATGVASYSLIDLEVSGGKAAKVVLKDSELVINNEESVDLSNVVTNWSNGDIVIDNSNVQVNNINGCVFLNGNFTVKNGSDIDASGVNAGFYLSDGQTLDIQDTSTVDITNLIGDNENGIVLNGTATYTKAETATVNATHNGVAMIGDTHYATLDKALAAAKDGDTVTLIVNLELAAYIEVPSGVTLTAAEDVVITLKEGTMKSSEPGVIVLKDGAILNGVTIQMPATSTELNAVYMRSNSTVQNCTVIGVKKYEGGNEVTRAIMTMSGATNIEISGNTFKDVRQPAYVNGGVTGTIEGNHLDGAEGWIIAHNSDMTIIGNTFGDNYVADIAIIDNGAGADNYAGKTVALSQTNNNAMVENFVEKTAMDDGKLVVKGEFVATGDMTGVEEIVLADPNATVKGAEGLEVTTTLESDYVDYSNGAYRVVDIKVNVNNLTLENSLAMNFWIRESDLNENAADYKVVMNGPSGEVTATLGNTFKYVGVDYYQVSYPGLAAKQMNEVVTIEIQDTAGNVVSNLWGDSIRGYAEYMINVVEKNQKTELTTALVDMLNYGAAAQVEFKDQSEPANAGLTAEQKSWATDSVDLSDADEWNGGSIGYGSNLELKNNIILHVWFKNANITKAVVNYTHHNGDKVENKEITTFTNRIGESIKSVAIDDLVVADGATVVTVDFYSGDTKVGTVTESINSYLAYMDEKSDNELYDAIAKFTNSAWNLFH